MPSHLMMVYSRPLAGQEAAYNKWYTEEHVPDVLSVPGFVGAQRFEVLDADGSRSPTPQYLAIYEIEAPGIDEAQARLAAAVASGQVTISDTLDKSSLSRVLLRPISERRASDS